MGPQPWQILYSLLDRHRNYIRNPLESILPTFYFNVLIPFNIHDILLLPLRQIRKNALNIRLHNPNPNPNAKIHIKTVIPLKLKINKKYGVG